MSDSKKKKKEKERKRPSMLKAAIHQLKDLNDIFDEKITALIDEKEKPVLLIEQHK